MAVILLPALKIKSAASGGGSYQDAFHKFLMASYDGYTVASGNITGYWRDGQGRQQYSEHVQYRVALSGKAETAGLERYLAELAHDLQEESIYLETGKIAWLIQARKKRA